MSNYMIYMIQSGIALGIFYIFYWTGIRQQASFQFNRVYLLGSVLLSLIIPLISVEIQPTRNSLNQVLLDAVVVGPGSTVKQIGNDTTFLPVVFNIYLLISLFFLLRFLQKLLQLISIVYKSNITYHKGIKIVETQSDKAPFTFFGILFIKSGAIESESFKNIFVHEREHIRQGHSFDILIIELLLIIQWFNPFVWLVKQSLRSNHEFQADDAALNSGLNAASYQKLLINQAFEVPQARLASQFNHSLIKKRIIMMSKTKPGLVKRLRAISFVPLSLVVVFFLTISIQENSIAQEAVKAKKQTESKVTQEKQENQIFTVVEKMPEFPGGTEAFNSFLAENIKYPAAARKEGKEGKVFVTFVVEKDGSVSSPEILRGFDKECDAEALRVVSMLPNYKPGEQRGRPVRVQFNVPIYFKLDKKSKEAPKDIPASPSGK